MRRMSSVLRPFPGQHFKDEGGLKRSGYPGLLHRPPYHLPAFPQLCRPQLGRQQWPRMRRRTSSMQRRPNAAIKSYRNVWLGCGK